MGGEEFIILSPNAELNSIQALCERVREQVEKQQPTELMLSRLVTVSIGAAVADQLLDRSWSDTLKRSDQALYDAKAAGRNCVRISNLDTKP